MCKYLLFSTILCSIASPILAQEEDGEQEIVIADAIRDTYITVVASGSSELITATGQPVSIIGADEIQAVQGGDIVRVLERLPGVTITRNGGVGGFGGVRVRGADAEQLLVLVDGVRVADTASPANGFDFGTLLPAGIDKIELLRGSNSTIWGSQAMGGVMAVTTLNNNGVSGSAEYGGPDSVYAQASAGKSWGPLIWGVDGSFFDNEGISSAAIGTEPDGLRQWQAGGRAEIALGEDVSLRATARHLDARLDLDGFPPPTYSVFDDTAEYQDTRRTSGSAGIDYRPNGLFSLSATWSLSDTQRESFDPSLGAAASYTTHGRDERAEVRGKWQVSNRFGLHFGAERAWSWMETLFDARKRARTTGAYAQAGFEQGPVVLNAGLRVDDHDRFGTAWSFGADGAVALGSGWRARASYGEGFKAPTLFQLLSDYGNGLLRPERSHGFDAGIELGDRGTYGAFFSLSAFRRDSTDLIDFISCPTNTGICANRPFGTYDNIGKVRAQGIEVEGGITVADALHLRGAYSYVEAKNRTAGHANAGNDLARRPRHAVTASADWDTPLAGLKLGADLRVVSDSFDDPGNFTPLDGYEVVTIRASIPVTGTIELYGRVENLFDATYQTTAGYGSPGRGAYIGARARF